jgi:CBS domain containing-hemolysin-like protein
LSQNVARAKFEKLVQANRDAQQALLSLKVKIAELDQQRAREAAQSDSMLKAEQQVQQGLESEIKLLEDVSEKYKAIFEKEKQEMITRILHLQKTIADLSPAPRQPPQPAANPDKPVNPYSD